MGAVRLLLVVVTRARYGGVARCRCCHQAWDPSPVTSLSWRWRHSNGSVTLDKCAPNHPPESHCMNIYYIYYLSIMMGWQLIYHRPDLTRDQPPVPSRSNTSPLDFALDSWLFIGNKHFEPVLVCCGFFFTTQKLLGVAKHLVNFESL